MTAQEYFNSGLANEESNLFENAISDYTKAIELDAKNMDKYKELGAIINTIKLIIQNIIRSNFLQN